MSDVSCLNPSPCPDRSRTMQTPFAAIARRRSSTGCARRRRRGGTCRSAWRRSSRAEDAGAPRTASAGSMCAGFMNQRGRYAPIGSSASADRREALRDLARSAAPIRCRRRSRRCPTAARDHEAAPQVRDRDRESAARAEMLRRHERDLDVLVDARRLPPVELRRARESRAAPSSAPLPSGVTMRGRCAPRRRRSVGRSRWS